MEKSVSDVDPVSIEGNFNPIIKKGCAYYNSRK
jgi:hypothetical protein